LAAQRDPRQWLIELRQSRAPHHGLSRGEHDRDVEDARGAGERDDIVAHLVRLEISNARNEPGLVVDEQEYGALRRQALVGAAPGALGLVCRFAVAHAHNVLLLQKGVSWRAQPSAAEYLKCVLPQATRHQQGLPGHVLRIRRCQIHRRRRDVIGLPHASKWYLRLDRF